MKVLRILEMGDSNHILIKSLIGDIGVNQHLNAAIDSVDIDDTVTSIRINKL